MEVHSLPRPWLRPNSSLEWSFRPDSRMLLLVIIRMLRRDFLIQFMMSGFLRLSSAGSGVSAGINTKVDRRFSWDSRFEPKKLLEIPPCTLSIQSRQAVSSLFSANSSSSMVDRDKISWSQLFSTVVFSEWVHPLSGIDKKSEMCWDFASMSSSISIPLVFAGATVKIFGRLQRSEFHTDFSSFFRVVFPKGFCKFIISQITKASE